MTKITLYIIRRNRKKSAGDDLKDSFLFLYIFSKNYLVMLLQKSTCGDFGHGANETHKSVEAFAEHAFKL